MTDSNQVWIITGASRGMGADFARAALAVGHSVVATARNPQSVTDALGTHDDLLAVKLDVTDPGDATSYATSTIHDYAERTAATIEAWTAMDGTQGGDPAKLADALVQLAALDEPPLRFAGGADAVEAFEQTAAAMLASADAHRALSSSLALDDQS